MSYEPKVQGVSSGGWWKRVWPSAALFSLLCLGVASACSGTPNVVQDDDDIQGGGSGGEGGSGQVPGGEGGDGPVVIGGAGGEGGATGGGMGGEGGMPSSVCGNGELDAGEACDDGNSTPADGCSGICTIEAGYACPEPGEPCVEDTQCGNGIIEAGENCDDGNNNLGDGCGTDCLVEPGWACSATECVPLDNSVCGDGLVSMGEQCDDGDDPPEAGDGCDADCQVEPGWRCRTPGQACEPIETEYCGDARLRAGEECDDGNARPGDGCNASCEVETGFVCPSGMNCVVDCGDGLVVGQEACDDGNEMSGDGCSANCGTIEPGYVCPIASGVGGPCVEQAPEAVCPNSKLEFGEECDDGNSTNGDGCTNCDIDPGYRCPKVGQPCEILPYCGDGYVDFLIGEQCDDGDMSGGDGCSADCQVEGGHLCPSPTVSGNRLLGGNCRAIVCGDDVIEGGEQCDDGGVAPGDGCSATCQVENGWKCPPTIPCLARQCGDGVRAGLEECDTGASNGTGTCSVNCRIVANPAQCGNGVVNPGEPCDDGPNDLPWDGCFNCKPEPSCPPGGGPCSSECGDGLLLPGDASEECDDGNISNGDGCSADCQIEPGFSCNDVSSTPNPFVLPVVYRDFQGSPYEDDCSDKQTIAQCAATAGCHPDFERFGGCGGSQTGIVQATLGADGKPVHFAGQRDETVNNDPGVTVDFFGKWYRDDAAYNRTILSTLAFSVFGTGYRFNNTTFFPIDGLGWGNIPVPPGSDCSNSAGGAATRNYHFTSEIRYWFEYQGGEQLDFFGDDDLWVFINKRLAIDVGGVHGQEAGNVILHATAGTGQVCDLVTTNCGARRTVDFDLDVGSVYEIVVFHAERNTCGSRFRLTLSNFNGTRSQCGSVCGDDIQASDEECDDGAGNNNNYGCSTTCELLYCGDGIVQTAGGEQCDDGSNDSIYADGPNDLDNCAAGCKFAPFCGDGQIAVGIEECDGSADCEDDCTLSPRCGDGDVNPGEECDEGFANGTLASECDNECRIKCGNGEIDAGEQCDPGSGNFSNGYGGCLPPAGNQPGCLLGPHCGDGIKNGPEQCDDGLNDGSYGTCAPGCVLGPRCGDDVLQETAGEQCDDGLDNVTTVYVPTGAGLCTTACKPVLYCGDGAVTNGEVCDDGVNDGSPGSCTPTCDAWVPLPSCGNGMINAGEECDDGNANGTAGSDCDVNCRIRCGNGIKDTALGEECDDGVNDGRYGTCMPNCTLAPYCGDGEPNGPEQCDDGPNNQSNPYGLGLCTLACLNAPYCGDDRIQTNFGEECDGQVGCLGTCKWSGVE